MSNKIFGPLVFKETLFTPNLNNTETKCLQCEDSFNLNLSLPVFLAHLLDVHHIVIEDTQNISNLPDYILYWRNKFKCSPIEEIIPCVKVGSTSQCYFLMSSLLKEDKELRHKLKLDYALKIQEFERTDKTFMMPCLFCRLVYEGTRHGFLEHLSTQHNLQLGNPQNLVFIEELISKINKKLDNLRCIYCEKTFPDRNVLKEHMRKKLHKRINPANKDYDKFYIVNYLEEGKTWKTIQLEEDRYAVPPGADANGDEEYSDWNEKEDEITCLFCDVTDTNINNVCLHMDADHDFDFVISTNKLDFYQKIKAVNYIRLKIHNKECIYCEESFKTKQQMQNHLYEEKHCKLPELKMFDQPEFYFPTYENDAFLYLIDGIED